MGVQLILENVLETGDRGSAQTEKHVLETGKSFRQDAPGGIFGAEIFANSPYSMATETGKATTTKAGNGESRMSKLETGKATPPPPFPPQDIAV
jgi:hypothetical protein